MKEAAPMTILASSNDEEENFSESAVMKGMKDKIDKYHNEKRSSETGEERRILAN